MEESQPTDRCIRHGARLLLIIASCGILLAGCAGPRTAAVPGGPYAQPEAALRALAASSPVGTVTATARIEINNHGERYPLKAAVMLRRPADLRLETMPLLGPPDFFLSIERGELRVFLPGKGAFYAGPATRTSISRFFPLALPAAEIVGLLMGRPPGEGDIPNRLGGGEEDGLYRVDEYREERRIRSLWIGPGGVLTKASAFTESGETAYTAEFTDHAQAGSRFMPQRVTISSGTVSLTVRYSEIRMLDDAASFALPVPAGVVPAPLPEG